MDFDKILENIMAAVKNMVGLENEGLVLSRDTMCNVSAMVMLYNCKDIIDDSFSDIQLEKLNSIDKRLCLDNVFNALN